MQIRHIGGIGDFGKFALVRYLAQNRRLAVCWYLTDASDGKEDYSKHFEYLALLWQIFWHDWRSWDSRIIFSVTHGWSAYWRADHGRHDITLGRRASKLAQAIFGSPGS